jgi:hypothetical protein
MRQLFGMTEDEISNIVQKQNEIKKEYEQKELELKQQEEKIAEDQRKKEMEKELALIAK